MFVYSFAFHKIKIKQLTKLDSGVIGHFFSLLSPLKLKGSKLDCLFACFESIGIAELHKMSTKIKMKTSKKL